MTFVEIKEKYIRKKGGGHYGPYYHYYLTTNYRVGDKVKHRRKYIGTNRDSNAVMSFRLKQLELDSKNDKRSLRRTIFPPELA